jgi:hypothetical protein
MELKKARTYMRRGRRRADSLRWPSRRRENPVALQGRNACPARRIG